jgi:hypothetical protein
VIGAAGTPPPWRSAQADLGRRQARRLSSVSRFNARAWSEYLRITPERFAIVHNGVDLDRFAPADIDGALETATPLDPSR